VNTLEKRIIELSYRHGLTHVSSCLNCVNLIDWIYEQRHPLDPMVLDNSHAALALYVVLENRGFGDAEEMVKKHGTHASRDSKHGIFVSGGSLGQPATVAVGMAMADKTRTVWLVTSDGSCMEGATCEAIRVGGKFCPNLKVFVVFNGFGAYGAIKHGDLPIEPNTQIYYVDQRHYPTWLRGLNGHYLKLSKEQHDELMA
jgi:transketolase N-terminal domain/subunit